MISFTIAACVASYLAGCASTIHVEAKRHGGQQQDEALGLWLWVGFSVAAMTFATLALTLTP